MAGPTRAHAWHSDGYDALLWPHPRRGRPTPYRLAHARPSASGGIFGVRADGAHTTVAGSRDSPGPARNGIQPTAAQRPTGWRPVQRATMRVRPPQKRGACSAVGSAPEWHSGGHRFDPGQVHHPSLTRVTSRSVSFSSASHAKEPRRSGAAAKAGRPRLVTSSCWVNPVIVSGRKTIAGEASDKGMRIELELMSDPGVPQLHFAAAARSAATEGPMLTAPR